MDSILEELYRAFSPDMISAGEREILKREQGFLDDVEARLSVEDFGRLWDIVTDISMVRTEESFALGYRLGVQLTLAAFQSKQLRI